MYKAWEISLFFSHLSWLFSQLQHRMLFITQFRDIIIILGIQVFFSWISQDICNLTQVVIIIFTLSHNVILMEIQLTGGLMEVLAVLAWWVCCMKMVHLCSKKILITFNSINGHGINKPISCTSKHLEG